VHRQVLGGDDVILAVLQGDVAGLQLLSYRHLRRNENAQPQRGKWWPCLAARSRGLWAVGAPGPPEGPSRWQPVPLPILVAVCKLQPAPRKVIIISYSHTATVVDRILGAPRKF
jgi:hypothetical protein